MTKHFLPAAAFLLAALPVFAQSPATPPAPPSSYKSRVPAALLTNGTLAPDFTAQDKDGKSVHLSDYKGKTVVLDFWATWCGICVAEMPQMKTLGDKYADKNVVVLAVNVQDVPSAFQTWTSKNPGYAPVIFAIDPGQIHIAALYHVSGLPTQYIIGKDGKITSSIFGFKVNDTRLEDALKAGAFSQPAVSGK